MNETRIRAGVLGATGYTGRELLMLLSGHAGVSIALATSQSEAGAPLSTVVKGAPPCSLQPVETAELGECDVIFSCLPHGTSGEWAKAARSEGARVIDLSSDLRVKESGTPEWARESVYGLTEFHRAEIAGAELVANPGCYPTAALLALAPLLRRGLVSGPVIIDAASGVTGAGRTPKRELLFAEVAGDYRAYAVGNEHRHLAELRDQVERLGSGRTTELVFTPHLLPVPRGILETIYVPLAERLSGDPSDLWEEDYRGEPFVEVLATGTPSLGDVLGTNRVAVGVATVKGVSTPLLILTVAIDNLLKGAAGQAVQNMNLMFGFQEAAGLP